MTLAGQIDHTILKADATLNQIHQVVTEATTYSFASVCVHGCWVAEVSRLLRDSPVKTCAVVGFPMGCSKPTIKAIEAMAAVKDGAMEIDFVANLNLLKLRDLPAIKAEFQEITRAVRSAHPKATVKVILETACLMQDVSLDEAEARIQTAALAAREAGCLFLKTSTGFHPAGGATVEAVRLLKKYADGLLVKASGGIRTTQDAMTMLEAGADRLGCSASVAIVQGAA